MSQFCAVSERLSLVGSRGGASEILKGQKAWVGTSKGAEWVAPSHCRGPGSIPEYLGQKPVFWFVLGKKMCSVTDY